MSNNEKRKISMITIAIDILVVGSILGVILVGVWVTLDVIHAGNGYDGRVNIENNVITISTSPGATLVINDGESKQIIIITRISNMLKIKNVYSEGVFCPPCEEILYYFPSQQ